MIIDFRARPPYKSFLKLSLYKPWRPLPEDPAEWGAFELGREPNITADAHDMDAFVKEMDDNGIVKAVLMGRHADNFGIVDNDELYELTQKYPGRFFPFAGINPREEGAVEEVERCISKMGFKGISVDPGWLNPPLKGDDPIFTPVYDKCAELGGILVMSVSAALGPDLTYSDPIIVQQVPRHENRRSPRLLAACGTDACRRHALPQRLSGSRLLCVHRLHALCGYVY